MHLFPFRRFLNAQRCRPHPGGADCFDQFLGMGNRGLCPLQEQRAILANRWEREAGSANYWTLATAARTRSMSWAGSSTGGGRGAGGRIVCHAALNRQTGGRFQANCVTLFMEGALPCGCRSRENHTLSCGLVWHSSRTWSRRSDSTVVLGALVVHDFVSSPVSR